jgi:uncharacterized protein YheU (UPF0270 family)
LLIYEEISVEIPFDKLSQELLEALIQEFVTREGTDYGEGEHSLSEKVIEVRKLLVQGKAKIVFDPESETCNIVAGWLKTVN